METILKTIKDIELTFARVTTAVIIVAASYICFFWGADCEVGINLLWQILATSLLCAIGNSIFLCNQECSKWKMLGRRFCHLLYCNILVLGAGYIWEWFDITNWKMIIFMEISVIAVFVLVTLISYLADYKTAEILNQKLQERNRE